MRSRAPTSVPEVVAPELVELAPMAVGQWDNLPTMVVAEGPLSPLDAIVKRSFLTPRPLCAH